MKNNGTFYQNSKLTKKKKKYRTKCLSVKLLPPPLKITNFLEGLADGELVETKTSTPLKIKTIKKHSKIPLDIKKQQQQRPKVDNIEWKRDDDDHGIDEIDDKLIREISTVNMEDITEPDSQQIQHVTIISQIDDESDNETKPAAKEMDDELTENRINSESVCKTFGSSSGSDVALHEPGAELSDDETGT